MMRKGKHSTLYGCTHDKFGSAVNALVSFQYCVAKHLADFVYINKDRK